VVRRLLVVLGLLAALVPGTSAAGPGDVDTQLLYPTFSPYGWFGSSSTATGDRNTWRIGGMLQYEHAPMVVVEFDTELENLISNRVGLTLGGSWTVGKNLAVGLGMPLYLQGGSYRDFAVKTFTPGDLRANVLWGAVDIDLFQAALEAELFLPTALRDTLAGEQYPRVAVAVIGRVLLGRFSLLFELSAMFRARVRTGYNFNMGQELALLLGAGVWIKPKVVEAFLEFQHRGGLANYMQGGAENPVDIRGGIRVHTRRKVALDFGVGGGLNGGYGTAAVRFFAGVTARMDPPEKPEFDQLDVDYEDPLDDGALADIIEVEDEGFVQEIPPEPLAELVEDRIEIREPIQFEFNSDVLLPVSYPILDEVMAILAERPEIALVLIEGHASLEGTITYNYDLSTRRARSVFHYIVNQGVNLNRLAYRGMGEAVPAAQGIDEAALSESRRVEFHVKQWLDPETEEIPDWQAIKPPVPWSMAEPEIELAPDGWVPPRNQSTGVLYEEEEAPAPPADDPAGDEAETAPPGEDDRVDPAEPAPALPPSGEETEGQTPAPEEEP
jgi:outer membrane protein OmpA-like peptidoglycan-associated protein